MILRNCPKPIQKRRNQFGLLIRRFRIEAGLTQRELTNKLHLAGWSINQPAIANMESGKRSLLDYEMMFFLDLFGKGWNDVVRDGLEPKKFPKPQRERQNYYGKLIRRFRIEKKMSQEKLATKLQLAGWDIDCAVVARIEHGERSLSDLELKFILDVLEKKSTDIFEKRDTQTCTKCKKKL